MASFSGGWVDSPPQLAVWRWREALSPINGTVGRAARFALPIATRNRRLENSLPASDEGAQNWAAIASLIETCKLNSVNLHGWLADTLRKLVYRWPASLIDELMPWAFTPAPTSMCD